MKVIWKCVICGITRNYDSSNFPVHCCIKHEFPIGVIGGGCRIGLCIHKGDETRREKCGSCNGNVEVKVFACAAHGECTISKAVGETACCLTCKDYAAIAPDGQI